MHIPTQGISYSEYVVESASSNPIFIAPDCGSVSEMLYNATKRRPTFIGKPEPTMALLAMEKTGFSKKETDLMGDRLYTDIACGVNAGISSIFVLSGEGTLADLDESGVKPDFVYENIRELIDDLNWNYILKIK